MPPETAANSTQLATQARALIRGARTATLATILAENGAPYCSLVLSATCPDATPLLLLSKLAVHTGNLLRDPRASLLYDATGAREDPLTGARLTLVGSILPVSADKTTLLRDRFLARHPSGATYVDFGDFSFYRLEPDRAHLVAGFGHINWIEGSVLLLSKDKTAEIAAAEPGILAHMNTDHSDSITLYAEKLLGLTPGPWRMVGCDVEGCDLALGGTLVRLPFAEMAFTAVQLRQELVRLAQQARAKNP